MTVEHAGVSLLRADLAAAEAQAEAAFSRWLDARCAVKAAEISARLAARHPTTYDRLARELGLTNKD